ncbi:RNA exonuclease 1 DEDDh 3'-5' exonuclease domain protein (macronuclear) [Tetrahymena thermophila SB210]|uniref:RNA exonuclease 4 n=1 Tax=Tetrahymena thermophila (strain SB210) TaxID=312017 RepID=Q22S54_TETTS|nr:RNA exonuclease 1 DEDDh 3'-5' exonuclease domain protein [Tetrahymena thermophila SB210]EAR87918.3 RNA exonuclease 1 DEDDh 3'-5' exonuclease domain protein [Tetrahymena thermophila SB210]|eukprot:XP_001008163.3 RNA exonuclease 1 DEDDh 3'-5' exonuclease domain protein [Tetrahymena thermophila SB210]
MVDQVEDLELIKKEKDSQLKILESLDFSCYNSNKDDLEEQFGGQVKKKFKNQFGDAKNVHQKDRKFNKVQKTEQKNEQQTDEQQKDNQENGEEVKQQKQIRNVKQKAPQEVSSNWKKFMSSQPTQSNDNEDNSSKKQITNKKSQSSESSGNQQNVFKSLEPQKDGYKGVTPIVAIDCEMVQCEASQKDGFPTQELARVSIVNYNGHVLLDTYVRPQKKIKNYLTKVSGITFTHIKNAPTYPEVKNKIFEILKDKIIVGHSVQHDLSSIKFEPPKDKMIRDISNYKELKQSGKKVSLKKMVKQELGITFQEGSHDSISDARAALLIYKKYQKQIDQEQGKK